MACGCVNRPYFGGRNISAIIGVLYTSVAIGTLIGPSAAGFAFDISHSYMLPILFSVGANLVAAAIMGAMSRLDASSARAGSAKLDSPAAAGGTVGNDSTTTATARRF